MQEANASERPAPFACAMCGNCCRIDGFVRVTPEECGQIAAFLGIALPDFLALYTRAPEIAAHATAGDFWLTDSKGPGRECVFLRGNLCVVNEVKPASCRGFPITWRTATFMEYCEGMRRG